MKKPRICAVIVDKDFDSVKQVEPLVDLFEVRLDLIGDGWQELARRLSKPWLGCNRIAGEGGKQQEEGSRIESLLEASRLGADVIDIELRTENLEKLVPQIKKRSKCLLSFHDLKGTPALDAMKKIVERQLAAGADICKVVATAQNFEDNLTTLQLIRAFPRARVVSFAMGPLGLLSRVFCPLVGGDFTYASLEKGRESAAGQLTVNALKAIYGMIA